MYDSFVLVAVGFMVSEKSIISLSNPFILRRS
jgi:hypothetical protein